MNPELSLLVLKTSKVDEMLGFYSALGLEFVQEQHGQGPIHHSSALGDTVLEIYPGESKALADVSRLGFRVTSVDTTFDELKNKGATVKSLPKDSPWGRRAVLSDPDGRAVEIVSTNN